MKIVDRKHLDLHPIEKPMLEPRGYIRVVSAVPWLN